MLKEIEKYKFVEFGDKFNKPVDNLPSKIEYLEFGLR